MCVAIRLADVSMCVFLSVKSFDVEMLQPLVRRSQGKNVCTLHIWARQNSREAKKRNEKCLWIALYPSYGRWFYFIVCTDSIHPFSQFPHIVALDTQENVVVAFYRFIIVLFLPKCRRIGILNFPFAAFASLHIFYFCSVLLRFTSVIHISFYFFLNFINYLSTSACFRSSCLLA